LLFLPTPAFHQRYLQQNHQPIASEFTPALWYIRDEADQEL